MSFVLKYFPPLLALVFANFLFATQAFKLIDMRASKERLPGKLYSYIEHYEGIYMISLYSAGMSFLFATTRTALFFVHYNWVAEFLTSFIVYGLFYLHLKKVYEYMKAPLDDLVLPLSINVLICVFSISLVSPKLF